MHEFGPYFRFGLEHILTWEALDHILFVTALCLRYQFSDYRRILLLVTAFTAGHCSTLVLGTLNLVAVRSALTEFFIAVTIVLTALSNLTAQDGRPGRRFNFIYLMALVFGMVHGLGFAAGLKSILGREQSIVVPLLAFNTGIELAQLLVAAIVLTLSWIFVSLLHLRARVWVIFVSLVILFLSVRMAIERFPRRGAAAEYAIVRHPAGNSERNQIYHEETLTPRLCGDYPRRRRPIPVLQQPAKQSREPF